MRSTLTKASVLLLAIVSFLSPLMWGCSDAQKQPTILDKKLEVFGANYTLRIAQDTSGGSGYSFYGKDGNPRGIAHLTQSSGPNVRLLTTNDVTFNVNTLAVATKNSQRIQAILDNAPQSGITLQIPHDLCITGITFPTTTIINGGSTYTGQHIPCAIVGTRPGVAVLNMSNTNPAFSATNSPVSEGVFRPIASVKIELRNLEILSRTPCIKITGLGLTFESDNITCWSEATNAVEFRQCYGMNIGEMGVYASRHNGFYFEDCIHVTCNHLWARACEDNGIVFAKVSYGNSNFFGSYDMEGNEDYQMVIDWLKDSRMDVYMEGNSRATLTNCQNIDMTGNGVRMIEADNYSRILCPKLFTVVRTSQSLPFGTLDMATQVTTFWNMGTGWANNGVEIEFETTGTVINPSTLAAAVLGFSCNGSVVMEDVVQKSCVYKTQGFVPSDITNRIYYYSQPSPAAGSLRLISVTKLTKP